MDAEPTATGDIDRGTGIVTDGGQDLDLPPAPDGVDDADVPGRTMDDDLRQRREQTWELLVVRDESYTAVCETLADEYDVTVHAIEKDIARMDDWLPKLDAASTKSGASRIRELRRNRKRRRELLREVQADPEASRSEELRLLREIDEAVQMDVQISQSVGMTQREPHEHVTKHEGNVEHTLTDTQREHLATLKQQARDQIPEREDVVEVENLNEREDGADDGGSGDGAEAGAGPDEAGDAGGGDGADG